MQEFLQASVASRKRMTQFPCRTGLLLSLITFTAIAEDEAEATGRWRVRAGRKTSSGGFELKFRRIGERWLIVSDHTTSDDPKDESNQ